MPSVDGWDEHRGGRIKRDKSGIGNTGESACTSHRAVVPPEQAGTSPIPEPHPILQQLV